MNNILLISEDYLKTNSALNDNTFGKFLLPAIREAQDINLTQLIGSCIFNELISKVGDGTIGDVENTTWKTLLDEHVQMYLVYQVEANLIPIINIKMGNIGSVVSQDEYIQTLSQNNIDLVQNYFQTRADFYAKRITDYIKNHAQEFKEYGCGCNTIDPSKGTASTTIWLG